MEEWGSKCGVVVVEVEVLMGDRAGRRNKLDNNRTRPIIALNVPNLDDKIWQFTLLCGDFNNNKLGINKFLGVTETTSTKGRKCYVVML